MEIRKLEYRGRPLADLKVYELSDWRNQERAATAADLRLINVTAAADAVRDALRAEPKKVEESEPDQPWVMVVVREATTLLAGTRDQKMEEDVLMMYVNRHGMNQILEIWGADVGSLVEELGKLSGIEDVPQDN